jgi:putative flavoprotein involved in K+ transport
MLETVERRVARPWDVGDAERVRRWLSHFEDALDACDGAALEALFIEDAHWRDLVAFTWTITPVNSRNEVVSALLRYQPHVHARSFKIAEGRTPPRQLMRGGVPVIEAIYEFKTDAGRCQGVLRLPATEPERAWIISTSLKELKGFEEPVDDRRPDGADHRIFGGESWGQRRRRERSYDDHEPDVLIVGGGHCGLETAARLRLLGVDALVVERLPKVGDVWRRRYNALALHNGIKLNQLPYMPFPASWPKYLSKDMLGEWLEAYAIAMESNVWTDTSFVRGRYNEEQEVWEAVVRRGDGSERTLRPRHLVFANGILSEPKIPDLPGLKNFRGEVLHSHFFDSGAPWHGKNVIVMGAGTTAHDIAQDLHGHGANVKLVQRGSVTVFSVKSASINHSTHYTEHLPLEDADLIVSCNTFEVLLRGYKLAVQRMLELDKDLLAGLKAKGFKLDLGAEGGGHQMKVRASHGGYYLNVGCSELIIEGQIGLLHYEDIDRFVSEGAQMKDGSLEAADLVLIATGYRRPEDVISEMLGKEIAEKIGPVWGMAEDGEMCNMYKPTPQRGLWFIGGGFAQGRIWSHYLALQVKAHLAGIAPERLPERPRLHALSGGGKEYREGVALTDKRVPFAGAAAGTDGL